MGPGPFASRVDCPFDDALHRGYATATMKKAIAAILGLAVVTVLVLASTKPDHFHVERSVVIDAPREQIFDHIDNLHAWHAWSPYDPRDPKMKRTFSGSERGLGAIYGWDGNDAVGQGSVEITESNPPSLVVLKLDFVRPFEGHNVARFALEDEAGKSKVTWGMDGPATFMSKVMQVFMDFDEMVGGDFETGLSSLKSLVEAEPREPGDAAQGEDRVAAEEPAQAADSEAQAP